MRSKEAAHIFREIAKILELKKSNPFRIRAYERAAAAVENLGDKIDVLIKEDNLTSIPGIGADLASKIKEIVSTGSLKYYEEIRKDIPEGVIQMLRIPGLGPKTVKLIYDELHVDTVDKLEKAARQGLLRELEGIREKTEENILRGIELFRKGDERILFYYAAKAADSFVEEMKKMKEVEKIEVAGSLRRRKETIRDVDILVVSKNPSLVMDKFTSLPLVSQVLAKGETKSSVIAKEDNIQVDVRVIDNKSFGSALMYFTGSKEFNIRFRQLAIKEGYKINEYGVFFTGKGAEKGLSKGKEKMVAGKTEKDIFSLFKMSYIPPELREDRGELEAALKTKLPKLIESDDVKGDFHVHSKYSDGRDSIEQIVKQAVRREYEYIGIADHSQSLQVAGGLSIEDVYKKIEEVKKVQKKFKSIKVLCGTEVDILSGGQLDYPDSLLKELDFVIAAIHSGFKQSKEQLTKRIISACGNKYVNIIAHPTGVLWGVRDPYDIDLDQILEAAGDYNVGLEINCCPERCDLNDINVMKAKDKKAKLVLGTDAHSITQLGFMDFGVNIARRGWLQKSNVLNCLSQDKVLKWLKK